ncbi:MAG: 5-(carboxyamino)imidazole ribonucleotide synthase [Burkholderiaceae bacterium]
MMKPLAPGAWLGLLGGGQLGRMFCMAAQSLGYRVCVLEPAADSPAGAVADRHLRAAYDDEAALDALAQLCSAATTEFENVPAPSLERLSRRISVCPGASAVAIAQDRIAEKEFIHQCGIPVAPYCVIRSREDLLAVPEHLFPAILKAARLGYDGKGQMRVANREEAIAAFGHPGLQGASEGLGGVPCVLEQRLALDKEISVVVARARDGSAQAYPVSENEHRAGILALSIVPARVSDAIARQATEATLKIAQALDYVGVLCVEFFVLKNGTLVANEMAPRPHNSGHYTIDACVSSQFEQQARIMAGLPLGSPRLMNPAVMVNLLGDIWGAARAEGSQFKAQAIPDTPSDVETDEQPDWPAVLALPGAKLHLYGKTEARQGRKMGHITVVEPAVDEALATALRIEKILRIV